MVEFSAGKWIIGLLLYFFCFYLVVWSTVATTIELDVETGVNSVKDPGFQKLSDPFSTGGFCSGTPEFGCGHISDNVSCEYIRGCNWNDFSSICYGNVGDPVSGLALSICSPSINQTYCKLAGCAWTTYSSYGDESYSAKSVVSNSPFRATIAIMTGFGVDIGLPVWVNFIYSFLFFWVPFVMLLWSLYVAIPFI